MTGQPINSMATVRELTNGKDYDILFKSISNAFRANGIRYLIPNKAEGTMNSTVQVKDTGQGVNLMITTNSLSEIGQRYILECETVQDALASV